MKKYNELGKKGVLGLVLIISLILGGCTPAQDNEPEGEAPAPNEQNQEQQAEDVSVRFGLWGAEEEINAYADILQGSEEMFPGVSIEIQPYPSSQEFWNNLPAQIAAKTAPDIVQLTNEGSYEYIQKGLFLPVGDIVEEEGLDMTDFAQSAVDIWSVDGKLYGMPVSVGPAMFFINEEMWEKAGLTDYPETWEEVKAAAEALTTDDVKGIIINIHPFHFTNYALTHGGGWGYGDTINSEENVEALEFIFDMYEEGLAVSPQQAGFGWDGEVFANKKAAMSTGGHWYKTFLKNAAPGLRYTVIPMPYSTDKTSTAHSNGIVVLKDTANANASVKAAYYLTREEGLEELMKRASINPARKALSEQYFEINPEFKEIEEMVPLAQDFGYPADTKKFTDALVKAVEERILKPTDKSAKEILDEIQAQFE